jgi:hypothetical protein
VAIVKPETNNGAFCCVSVVNFARVVVKHFTLKLDCVTRRINFAATQATALISYTYDAVGLFVLSFDP